MNIGQPRPDAPPHSTHGSAIPLWTEAFATDPNGVYQTIRNEFGAFAPVELAPGVPATLVTKYRTALTILRDSDRFPADPRTWQKSLPEDCPVGPMMEWRPNAIRSAGQAHRRYRSALTAALDRIDEHRLHATIERIALARISTFCESGRADVVRQYALPVVSETLNVLQGCSPELSERAVAALASMFDAGADAAEGNRRLEEALRELIADKRANPGADVTSWLMRHPATLDDDEVLHQLVLLYAAGGSPPQNLIVNTLLLMLTDQRFGGDLLGGSLSTPDAIDEVLFNNSPLPNYCISYPDQPVLMDGYWLPAHQPVLIGIALCNNDPDIRAADTAGNRAHLAFSAGTHACPARSLSYLIVQQAIDQLLDVLPDLALEVPESHLQWRPGPFHRALQALPVTFPGRSPVDPLSTL